MRSRWAVVAAAASWLSCGGLFNGADVLSLIPEDTEEVLRAHNALRLAPNPPPKQALEPLVWSETLAETAKAWAQKCQFEHNAQRGEAGENLWAGTSPGSAGTAVSAWGEEAGHYDYAAGRCAVGEQCGHYTQVVWADTTEVGCARVRCRSNSPFAQSPDWYFWVCNYRPPGNVVGERPY